MNKQDQAIFFYSNTIALRLQGMSQPEKNRNSEFLPLQTLLHGQKGERKTVNKLII